MAKKMLGKLRTDPEPNIPHTGGRQPAAPLEPTESTWRRRGRENCGLTRNWTTLTKVDETCCAIGDH